MTASQSASVTETTSQPGSAQNHKYDIILYGATSFVGQLTAQYLATFSQGRDLNWAMAGRNLQKLETVKASIAAPDVDILLADSTDSQSLDALCTQTRVIISTVGPYLKFGEPMIQACVNNGTDYVDLTGEAIFIKDMMDKYQARAQETGARIVNSCGFDSIPSDLGVYFTQQHAQSTFGEPCDTINMRVKAMKGGLSGGTVASMSTIFTEASKNPARRKQLANPYLLNDDSERPNATQNNLFKPVYDTTHHRWLAPFIMSGINTRVVHRSNQLQGYPYGRQFKYDEALWMADGIKGQAMSYGMAAGIFGFATAMSFGLSRKVLNDHILPKSGTGPSPEEQENGFFDIRFFGHTAHQQSINTKVTGDKDPGYGSTSQMLAQSALCLAQDISKQDVAGGFWTPATAMGDKLITRLTEHAGITFELLP